MRPLRFLSGGVLALVGLLVAGGSPSPATVPEGAETVILLHGLGRGREAMFLLARRLEAAGYVTHTIGYSSLSEDPREIVADVEQEIEACCGEIEGTVHFVAHSLGGLIARAYLERHRPPRLGRVVLLGTPNQGSEIVDQWGDLRAFEVLGPTAAALGTGSEDFPASLEPPDYPVGVIAGTRSLNPFTSGVLPLPNDGTVSVASTRLPGMADFLEVDTAHTLLLYDGEVADAVLEFLRQGRFSPPAGSEGEEAEGDGAAGNGSDGDGEDGGR